MVEARSFTAEEHGTWSDVVRTQRPKRKQQLVPLFEEGLLLLGMDQEQIPNLQEVNRRLKTLTGWEGVLVKGLEGPETFYAMLAERKFPIGNFVRSRKDLNYTPEPDIIHDFYGHIPYYANKAYADACHQFGITTMKYAHDSKKLRQFERVFWFTYEFGLVKTTAGVRIFGAGIASSIGECEYALSQQPEVLPFDIETVRQQEFRIDEMQKRLFLMESPEQLYQCLPMLETAIKRST